MNEQQKILALICLRGYRIDKEGILKNPYGRELVGYINKFYRYMSYRHNGKVVIIAFHRIQAYQKFGIELFKEGIMVRHKNGNSLDNSFSNILIGTSTDNYMDQPKEVRVRRSQNRKYDYVKIKEFYKINGSKETLMKFGISDRSILSYIIRH